MPTARAMMGGDARVRRLARLVLALSLVALLWLVLFKLSVDIPEVLRSHIRGVNLVPFAGVTRRNAIQVVLNTLAFLPFGALLGVNRSGARLRRLLLVVCGLSVAVELIQYAFAIGVTDVTDVISNTAGGLLGILLYRLSARRHPGRRVDAVWCGVLGIVLVALLAVVLVVQIDHRIRRSAEPPPVPAIGRSILG